jgi:hypothetical protein
VNVSARQLATIFIVKCLNLCHNFENDRKYRQVKLILRAMLPFARYAAAAMCLAAGTSALAAPTGYSVRSDVDRKLYSIDMASGVATALGATGFNKIEGLAVNDVGEIFGVNPATAQLVKCSSATGACSAVGVLGGLPQIQTNAGLAFSSTGSLFLAANAVIYRVDPATAAASALGTTGPALSGLAGVAPSDRCSSGIFGMGGNNDKGKIYCVDTSNGVATLLGSINLAPLDVGLDGDTSTGLVWGVTNDVPAKVFSVTPSTLTVGNISTVTLAGEEIGGFESLAIAHSVKAAAGVADPRGVIGIPTLSLWTLIALAALIASIGVFVARRRGWSTHSRRY